MRFWKIFNSDKKVDQNQLDDINDSVDEKTNLGNNEEPDYTEGDSLENDKIESTENNTPAAEDLKQNQEEPNDNQNEPTDENTQPQSSQNDQDSNSSGNQMPGSSNNGETGEPQESGIQSANDNGNETQGKSSGNRQSIESSKGNDFQGSPESNANQSDNLTQPAGENNSQAEQPQAMDNSDMQEEDLINDSLIPQASQELSPTSQEELNEHIENHNIDETNAPELTSDNIDERKEKLLAIKNQLQKLLTKLNNGDNEETQEEPINKELEKIIINGEKEMPIETPEDNNDLSNANQELMDKLNQLLPFQDRQRGSGYAIDINSHTEIPNSVIRTLITRFLNQRFIKKDTDLNVRSNSFEQTSGFHKWDVKAVVTHLQTHQLTKVLTDKYGYEYANGKNDYIPLSFYFDMSGSMSSYTNMLAVIAIELLKKDVKVLVGYNETVNYQINSINKTISVEKLSNVLEKAGDNGETIDSSIKMKKINRNIDNYLLSVKAEKCVVFSDFDPLREVVNLSQRCNVYWFCFESQFNRSDLLNYNGFLYPVQNITDIAKGLIKVSEYRFQTLCYLEKEKVKVKTFMKYIPIYRTDINFKQYGNACIKNVVDENLITNGGTLFVPDAVFYSDIIILACENDFSPDNIIGFVALNTRSEEETYINQIAVKNRYKKRGIGKELVEQAKKYDDTKDVICHIKAFNEASQALFESCGFIKDTVRTTSSNYFYRHKTLLKRMTR